MLKNYSSEIKPSSQQSKSRYPKAETLFAILNYSKSVKVKMVMNKKVVLVLN